MLSGLRLRGDRNRRILYALTHCEGWARKRFSGDMRGHFRAPALPEDCLVLLPRVSKKEKYESEDLFSNLSRKSTFANLIANLSRAVLTTSESQFYLKTPYTGIYTGSRQDGANVTVRVRWLRSLHDLRTGEPSSTKP